MKFVSSLLVASAVGSGAVVDIAQEISVLSNLIQPELNCDSINMAECISGDKEWSDCATQFSCASLSGIPVT